MVIFKYSLVDPGPGAIDGSEGDELGGHKTRIAVFV